MTREQSQELTDLGFQQDKARRGVVSWILGIISVLLFMAVGFIAYLVRQKDETERDYRQEIKEINASYNGVLLKMLERSKLLELKVDTVIQKKL